MFEIINNNGYTVATVDTAYEAARIANAKADTYYKTYYVRNTKTNTVKPYFGFHATRRQGYYPFGRI